MKVYRRILIIVVLFSLGGCSSNKLITSKNTFFRVEEIASSETGSTYKLVKVQPTQSTSFTITEKTDFILLDSKDQNLRLRRLDSIMIAQEKVGSYLDLVGKSYYPESKVNSLNDDRLVYYDVKFGLQALTIPLKFRRSVGNDLLNPPTVETGVNMGFAPGWKFTRNIYEPTKNYLGKNTTQLSVVLGPHFGLGAVDLKKASNAPGLLSDRKSTIFSYGGYVMIGFNNINVGFALGRDHLLGEGKDNWVYQDKTWTGIIVSLDVIKF